MAQCRYRHVCRVCDGPNPAMACCDCLLGPRSSTGPSDQPLSAIRCSGLGSPPADQPPSGNCRFGPGPPHARRAQPTNYIFRTPRSTLTSVARHWCCQLSKFTTMLVSISLLLNRTALAHVSSMCSKESFNTQTIEHPHPIE